MPDNRAVKTAGSAARLRAAGPQRHLTRAERAWRRDAVRACRAWLLRYSARRGTSSGAVALAVLAALACTLGFVGLARWGAPALSSALYPATGEFYREVPAWLSLAVASVLGFPLCLFAILRVFLPHVDVHRFWPLRSGPQRDGAPDRARRMIRQALEQGQLERGARFRPAGFWRDQTRRQVDEVLRLLLVAVCVFGLLIAYDATIFRSWQSDSVLHSSPWSLSAHRHEYAEALPRTANCLQPDEPARTLVFADGHRFDLSGHHVPGRIKAVTRIQAVSQSETGRAANLLATAGLVPAACGEVLAAR